jgi:hypothetical protein
MTTAPPRLWGGAFTQLSMTDADTITRLNYALNYLRLPLKIDPGISNVDTDKLLAAFERALGPWLQWDGHRKTDEARLAWLLSGDARERWKAVESAWFSGAATWREAFDQARETMI